MAEGSTVELKQPENADAIAQAVERVTQRNPSFLVHMMKSSKKEAALEAFKQDAADLLEHSRARIKDRHDIGEIDYYIALCLTFIKHSRDERAIKDLLIHAGRVLGHDKQTIHLDDRASFQKTLEDLRKDFLKNQEHVVDADVTVSP